MQLEVLERAPHRGSFRLGRNNAANNVMQLEVLERAPHRGSFQILSNLAEHNKYLISLMVPAGPTWGRRVPRKQKRKEIGT